MSIRWFASILFVGIAIVACGRLDESAVGADGGTGAETVPTADSGVDSAPSLYPEDSGPVTSFYGGFHQGIGSENNLAINADGTWSTTSWSCGPGGGGGGCGNGIWQKDGDALKLLAADAKSDFSWFGGSTPSVTVTIVSGALHTVGATAIDFHPGYECYVDCDESPAVTLCTQMSRHFCR